jgi:hypothetical protein
MSTGPWIERNEEGGIDVLWLIGAWLLPHVASIVDRLEVPPEALRALQPRIQNVFWKSQRINAVVMHKRVD